MQVASALSAALWDTVHWSLTLARTHHLPTVYSHCLHSLYLPLLPDPDFFFFTFCVTVGVPTCKTKPICQQSSHEWMIDCLIYVFQHASFSVRLSATYLKLVLQYKPSGPICLCDNVYECDFSWNYMFFVTGVILFDVIMYLIWLSCTCQRCLLTRIFLWWNSLPYTAILMSLKSCHHMYKYINIYIQGLKSTIYQMWFRWVVKALAFFFLFFFFFAHGLLPRLYWWAHDHNLLILPKWSVYTESHDRLAALLFKPINICSKEEKNLINLM